VLHEWGLYISRISGTQFQRFLGKAVPVEREVRNPSGNQVECRFWLIKWHHMPRNDKRVEFFFETIIMCLPCFIDRNKRKVPSTRTGMSNCPHFPWMFLVEGDPGESRGKFKFVPEWVIFKIFHPNLFSLDKIIVNHDGLWSPRKLLTKKLQTASKR